MVCVCVRCDQLTGDSSGEAESWANAARQFLMAEDQLYQARNASYVEMVEAAVHCFLLAIHVSIMTDKEWVGSVHLLKV